MGCLQVRGPRLLPPTLALLMGSASWGGTPQEARPGAARIGRRALALVQPAATGAWSYRDPDGWAAVAGWDCNLTGEQSPINVQTTSVLSMNFALIPLGTYYTGSGKVATRATTLLSTWELQFPVADASASGSSSPSAYILWAGKTFTLQSISFHSPSENAIDGAFFGLEGQMVHKASDGGLLIVAQLFNVGRKKDFLEQFWATFPRNASTNPYEVPVDNPYRMLVPSIVGSYFTWTGSTTTPPCTTDVTWILAKQPDEVSQYQLDTFRRAISAIPGGQAVRELEKPGGFNASWETAWGGNSRPLQDLALRQVSYFDANIMAPGIALPALGAMPPDGQAKPGCDAEKTDGKSAACPVVGLHQGGSSWSWTSGPVLAVLASAAAVSLVAAVVGLHLAYTKYSASGSTTKSRNAKGASSMRRRNEEEFRPLVPADGSSTKSDPLPGTPMVISPRFGAPPSSLGTLASRPLLGVPTILPPLSLGGVPAGMLYAMPAHTPPYRVPNAPTPASTPVRQAPQGLVHVRAAAPGLQGGWPAPAVPWQPGDTSAA